MIVCNLLPGFCLDVNNTTSWFLKELDSLEFQQ